MQNQQVEDTYDSSIASGCMLYVVFSRVAIPPDKLCILDNIILASRRGLVSIRGEDSAALLFLNSLAKGTIVESGSHVPMLPFPDYPWAGKSLDEIYDFFREIRIEGSPLAKHNFAIVDKQTLRDGTLVVCSDSDGSLAVIRADGFSSLVAMVPDEMKKRALRNYGPNGFTMTEEYLRDDELEYLAGVQAKVARGEPLREIEKLITGLDDKPKDG